MSHFQAEFLTFFSHLPQNNLSLAKFLGIFARILYIINVSLEKVQVRHV